MIDGRDVTEDIQQYIREIVYTEAANGETDSIDITVWGDKWINEWFIEKNMKIQFKIMFLNWIEPGDCRVLDCGELLTDSATIEGFPLAVTIKAVSVPVNGTKNTKKWEDISLSDIANDICYNIGCGLDFYGENVTIKSAQQSQETDIKFLYSLCSQYGKGMKVYRNNIVIYSREAKESEMPIDTIFIEDVADSYKIDDNTDGVYTGVTAYYKPEKTDETLTYTLGTSEKQIILDSAGSTLQEAELKAKAALYDANAEGVKLKFTTNGDRTYYAGTNYYIYGMGVYSGAYAIEKVTHEIAENKAYKQTVEAHAVALEKDRTQTQEMLETNTANANNGNAAAGAKIELSGVPVYISSTASTVSAYKTGTYYLYDGKDFCGRYRICENAADIGKSINSVIGYIDAKYV